MTISISRRGFLKFIAASIIPVPAIAKEFDRNIRLPYVQKGQSVNYIGPSGIPESFVGSMIVKSVGEFDGIGFPVIVNNGAYGKYNRDLNYYDTELSDFLIDVPPNFWHDKTNEKYPNVHTYVRTNRYGESISEAINTLNFQSFKKRA